MKYFILFIISIFFIGCGTNADSSSLSTDTGIGGSTARFAIVNNYLYTVDENNLNVFSINDTNNPVFLNEVFIGFRIETLFAFENNLFIGSQDGMFIYSLNNPEVPLQESSISHFTSCDPVVTDGTYAYVTLHSNSDCGNDINLLEIYDVTDVQNPILKHERTMINPKGLGLYNNYLIICDDEVKIFDISDPENMNFVASIAIAGFDVIIKNNHLLVVGNEGLYQYSLDATNIHNIELLSTISY